MDNPILGLNGFLIVFPSWCHGFLFHQESVCYAYNMTIAIWPTDRQWMRGGNTAHYKNMGEGIPQKASFHHLFTANVCDGGCKRLRERMQTFAVKRGSALRLRWVKLVPKSPVLFWIREQGGEMHLYPPGNFCRALISDVERTNRKLSFLLAERRVSDILIFGCESVPASLREKKG